MKKEHMIHIRVNKEEKEESSEILEELGTNLSAVINMLIKYIILYRGIPFEVVLPPVDTQVEEKKEDLVKEHILESEVVLGNGTDIQETADYPAGVVEGQVPLDNDVFDTSDLDLMREVLGITLEQEIEHTTKNISNPDNLDLLGMLDD